MEFHYDTLKEKADYLIPFSLFILIFYNNIFSSLFLLDFPPHAFFDSFKVLVLGNFGNTWYLFELLKLILAKIGIIHILFQLSFLISLIISYHYIRKLFSKAKFLFSVVFFFNPFVYSRIAVGQIGVLIAYLLLPAYIYYLVRFVKNDFDKREMIKTAIAFTIVGSFQLQFIIINLLIFFIVLLHYYLHKRMHVYHKINFKKILLFLLLILLLNSFWIQGYFSSSVLGSIDEEHKDFFAPKLSQDVPALTKIIGMWGFWREAGYKTTYNSLALGIWYFLTFTLLLLMLVGHHTSKDQKSRIFYSLWWIGVILGTGISHPYTRPFFDFLFANLPFFSGFRDSHKFVVLIALSYSYLCSLGVLHIRTRLKRAMPKARTAVHYIINIAFIALILIYTFPLIGLSGQFSSTTYPKSYAETDDFLTSQDLDGHIIYLPWESYLTYNWTINASSDGRIAVPINNVIVPVIQTNPGRWGFEDSTTRNISSCLKDKDAACLENSGVRFILKDRCAHYSDDYSWINMTLVHEDNCISVYQRDSKIDVDRSVDIPARFAAGTLISFVVLIRLLVILFKKDDDVSSKKRN